MIADRNRGLRIVSIVIGILGIVFLATGIGMFIGFAMPESRDMRIAQNTDYPTQTAMVTRTVSTLSTMGNERMYRVEFAWNGNTARTNPIYNFTEAQSLVGTSIEIRVNDDGRAVPVNFERSLFSILGWVFFGVFGGLGAAGVISAVIVRSVRRRAEENEGR